MDSSLLETLDLQHILLVFLLPHTLLLPSLLCGTYLLFLNLNVVVSQGLVLCNGHMVGYLIQSLHFKFHLCWPFHIALSSPELQIFYIHPVTTQHLPLEV